MRKTIDVATLVDYVNGILAAETDDVASQHLRWGAILTLEQALHATGNYNGFRYLTNKELPEHIRPGVRYGADGNILSTEARFHNTDETRRQYSAKCDLRKY